MYHCAICIKQFTALKTETDEENDEQYESCPHCGNDMFLADGPLTKELLQKLADKNIVKPTKPEKHWFKPKEEWLALEEERYAKEDKVIEAYIKSLEKL